MLNGNTLDFALVHNQLAPTTSLSMDGSPQCQTLVSDPGLPMSAKLQLYQAQPNNKAIDLAHWVSKTEQYLLQNHPWAAQGRAANLETLHQPLTPRWLMEERKTSILGTTQSQTTPGYEPEQPAPPQGRGRFPPGAPRCPKALAWRSSVGSILRHMLPLAPVQR